MYVNVIIKKERNTIFSGVVNTDNLPVDHWLMKFIKKYSVEKGVNVRYIGKNLTIPKQFIDFKIEKSVRPECEVELELY